MATLNSVELSPNNIVLDLNDTHFIMAVYDPDDYPDKTGTWEYDTNYIQILMESPFILRIKVINKGNTTITYTPNGDSSKKAKCDIKIGGDATISIKPISENVFVNDSFYIHILNSTPSFEPIWIYDKEVLELQDDSDYNRAHFKVLKLPSNPDVRIMLINDNLDLINTCTIQTSDVYVQFTPSSVTQKVGDDYYVDISYHPDDGKVSGKWKFDPHVILLNDSTRTRAHFKVYEYSAKPVQLIYTCQEVPYIHTCNFTVTELSDIRITPVGQLNPPDILTMYSGQNYTFNVNYIPASAPSGYFWDGDTNHVTFTKNASNNNYISIDAKYPKYNSSDNITDGLSIYNDDSGKKGNIQSNIINFYIPESKLEKMSFAAHELYYDLSFVQTAEIQVQTTPEYAFLSPGKWTISQPDRISIIPGTENQPYDKIYKFKLLKPTYDEPVKVTYESNDGNFKDECLINIGLYKPVTSTELSPSSVQAVFVDQIINFEVQMTPEVNNCYDYIWEANSSNFKILYSDQKKLSVQIINPDVGNIPIPDDTITYTAIQPDGTKAEPSYARLYYKLPTNGTFVEIDPPVQNNLKYNDIVYFKIKPIGKENSYFKGKWSAVSPNFQTFFENEYMIGIKITNDVLSLYQWFDADIIKYTIINDDGTKSTQASAQLNYIPYKWDGGSGWLVAFEKQSYRDLKEGDVLKVSVINKVPYYYGMWNYTKGLIDISDETFKVTDDYCAHSNCYATVTIGDPKGLPWEKLYFVNEPGRGIGPEEGPLTWINLIYHNDSDEILSEREIPYIEVFPDIIEKTVGDTFTVSVIFNTDCEHDGEWWYDDGIVEKISIVGDTITLKCLKETLDSPSAVIFKPNGSDVIRGSMLIIKDGTKNEQ